MVPPEQTNAEAYYYLKQMQSKTPIVVRLVDGEELRGWIEWYDKDVIKLNREHGPNLLIPKRSIKYLFKEEEERMHKRRFRPPGTPSSEGTSGAPG
jgi:sRNA-binding regulator protein Hfq